MVILFILYISIKIETIHCVMKAFLRIWPPLQAFDWKLSQCHQNLIPCPNKVTPKFGKNPHICSRDRELLKSNLNAYTEM